MCYALHPCAAARAGARGARAAAACVPEVAPASLSLPMEGFLSEAAQEEARVARIFAHCDADGDGVLSRAE